MSRVSVAMPNCDIGERKGKTEAVKNSKFKPYNMQTECGRAGALQKFFGGIQLAVFAGVVERHVAVGAFFAKVDFASVEGLGVNVDADGALVEFREIQDLMDGLEGVDISGMSWVQFVDFGGDNAASAAPRIAIINAEMLDLHPADRRGHPAGLTSMVVNAAGLADLPANGHALENFVLEDEVARVVPL